MEREDFMAAMDEFPSNAKKHREPKKEKQEKNIEKVVTGEVVQRKKPFGSKIKDVFLGGEFKSASRYIAAEVLLPALRNMIVDATSKGVERMIYGDSMPTRRGPPGRPRVSYNAPVERYAPRQRTYLPDQPPHVPRRRNDISDIVLVSREEAETVVERLGDIIEQYDVATVADLHDLVGLPSTYVDNNWGWTSINFVDIRQVRDGYLIDLPTVEPV